MTSEHQDKHDMNMTDMEHASIHLKEDPIPPGPIPEDPELERDKMEFYCVLFICMLFFFVSASLVEKYKPKCGH